MLLHAVDQSVCWLVGSSD